jgi:hypothetical protein
MMKSKLTLAALALLATDTAHAANPLEIRKAELTQSTLITEVKVEAIARYFTKDPMMFLRLRCEILDDKNKVVGIAVKDFSPVTPTEPLNIPTGNFFRPSIQLPRVDDADHASCRFANANDPLPVVDVKDVVVELLSTREVHITNRSLFRPASVSFSCRGPQLTSHYTAAGGLGHLGFPPYYTSPRQALPYGAAEECWATKVVVMPAQNLDDLRPSNW